MSKMAEYTCPPVVIPRVEQTAMEYLKTIEGTELTMPSIICVENLSGQTLKLVDQRCTCGKWVYGPCMTLHDGKAMVLLAAQAPLTLSGVGICLIFAGAGFTISCAMETTIMRVTKAMGFISEREERTAETLYSDVLDDSSAECVQGKSTFRDLVLEWGGASDMHYFTVYPTAKEDLLAKWHAMNESEIVPVSILSASPGAALHMIATQHAYLHRFLEAALAGALTELNYVEAEDAHETIEDHVQRDLKQSVELIWREFDTDSSGTLDEQECQQFMKHFYNIFVHESPNVIGRLLVQQNVDPQHYSYKLADDAVEKMQAITSKLDTKQLSEELFQNMWNVEGQVTEEEFLQAFLKSVQRLLQPIKEVVLHSKIKEEEMENEIANQTGKKRDKPVRPWKEAVLRRLRCDCF